MWTGAERGACFSLTLSLLPILIYGLEIPNHEEVDYIWAKTEVAAGQSVMLSCGSSLPDIYIWGYTKPGTEGSRAVVYNYGHGAKVQPLADTLGELSILANTSSLIIERVSPDARGLYTCQALFHTDTEPKVNFYFVQLDVLDETESR
ncbi:hypothetical protein Z043_119956 [Scleropages formosus]|uniref:Ig-like domain-containing protein n=1 Tax=Scleropages formosus TaxID=113540 RepID=A0A0P7UQV6_SCLFO|nr:hypothetical protein Z043_119956 [Scleropages formosus]